MAYALDVPPSQLSKQYWALTPEDIDSAIKLRVGGKIAELTQHYEILLKVVQKALGGEDKKSKANQPKTAAEATAVFNSMFG